MTPVLCVVCKQRACQCPPPAPIDDDNMGDDLEAKADADELGERRRQELEDNFGADEPEAEGLGYYEELPTHRSPTPEEFEMHRRRAQLEGFAKQLVMVAVSRTGKIELSYVKKALDVAEELNRQLRERTSQ